MTVAALCLLVALAGGAPTGAAQAPDTVRQAVVEGTVRATESGRTRPLPWAMVEVRREDGVRAVLADSTGRYRVVGVPPGRHRIRAVHVGYRAVDVEVLVPDRGGVELDLELTPSPVELPGLLVEAEPTRVPDPDERDAPEAGRTEALVSLRALELSPGLLEAGVGEAARSLPGNEPGDPTDVLLMRGSTQDLKLVLLDGAPVYTPFHLGGLIQSFDAGALGAARHHVGGAPARYDGGLSYILELRSRAPARDRIRASGSADLMSVQGLVEGPLGERAGLLLSSRALHALAARIVGGDGSPYGYVDGLLRADLDAGAAGRFRLTGFGNRESVFLDLPGDGFVAPTGASWGNGMVAAGWSGRAAGLTLDATASASRYRAELPVRRWALDEARTAWEETVALATGRTDRTRLAVDAFRPGDEGGLRAGFSFDRMRVAYGSRVLTPGPAVGPTRTGEGSVLGAYVDGIRPLTPGVDLRYGGRLDRFDPGGVRSALRLALLWNVSPTAILSLAGGRYHQLARLADTEAELAVGDGVQVGTGYTGESGGPTLAVASSDHLVVSLDQSLTPEVRLGLEGFLKSFHGLDGAGDALASSGVDLRVVRQGERSTAWLGYALSWYWETDAERAPSEFAGRHLLSAGFRGPLVGPTGVDLRVSFSDGLPLTAIPFASRSLPVVPSSFSTDEGPLPPTSQYAPGGLDDGFLRVDAEVWAEMTPVWGGRTVRLRPYLRVLNALDRRDALFYYFQSWRDDGVQPLADLSVVPVLGMEWRF